MTSSEQLKPSVPNLLSVTPPAAKLSLFRNLMGEVGLDAYWIPSTDEHLNEYLPLARERRAWLTDFHGSAGELLISQEQCWLFVDSRYHEQAERDVDQSLFQVVKLGLPGHKTPIATLTELGDGAMAQHRPFCLGFDPFTLTVGQWRKFKEELGWVGIDLVPTPQNLVDELRFHSPYAETDPIPPIGTSPLITLPTSITGLTIGEKLDRVREMLRHHRTDVLPITKLDHVAWLFNLRGQDIPYNPVFWAYGVVTMENAYLFTNLERMDGEVKQGLTPTVTLHPYEDYQSKLSALVHSHNGSSCSRVLLDIHRTTMGTYELLMNAHGKLVEVDSPVEILKAQKSAVELERMAWANLKASRAKTLTLKWLETTITHQIPVTEVDVAQHIEKLYGEVEGFQGLSFNTIAGAGTNSSIVHYGTPNPNQLLEPSQFLLLDSGAQYWGGTTDDTRTIIVGDPTPEQCHRYTSVLKAHINCAMQHFPQGTTGHQLDGIARWSLWQSHLEYGHGTGHGVGAFLNVHEGPNGISKRSNGELKPGMVTSIEPGYYQPGWGGIRLENLYVVVDQTSNYQPTGHGEGVKDTEPHWYRFAPLTYIPFDNRLIDFDQLDHCQLEWLNAYYQSVIEQLRPELTPEELGWLRQTCQYGMPVTSS